MKKSILISIVAVFAYIVAFAAPVVEKPTAKHPTSFAVIIDNETYNHCKEAVEAYCKALDEDHLSVYCIRDAWKTPEEVKAQLEALYNKNLKKMPLEGVVFIGDVPFVSVQNAQHMTAAFKMDEKAFPISDASVTSDRFYDDLHLKFERIKQDSINPLRYYYRLTSDSPQQINCTFYSGRILYPQANGGDKYEAIGKFLKKVVAERKKQSQIKYVVTYAGSGYNSDCLTAWNDQRPVLEEMFPLLKRNDYTALTQLNFRMDRYMKQAIFEQLQRPEVDVMLFNEHGSPDKQHVSSLEVINDLDSRLTAFRDEIYYELKQESQKPNADIEGAKAYFKEKYQLTDSFFADFATKEKKGENKNDITLEDLKPIAMQPRFVMFNACYNGSFHCPGYIAGSYLFNDGRTVVTQGNTVNVLQDRWTYEMLGLISHGARVGQYNRMMATLEGHILGDPAFHFTSVDDNTLATDLVTKRCDTPSKSVNKRNATYWWKLCDAPYADTQSAALRMLADGNQITPEQLLAKYRKCPYAVTRMECLKLLSRTPSDAFITAIGEALYDANETVRRNAANYSWQVCEPALADKVADVVVNYPESQRVCYLLMKTLQLYPEKIATEALRRAIDRSDYPTDMDSWTKDLTEEVADAQQSKAADMKKLLDNSTPLKRRIMLIRSVRNNTYHEYVSQLISLMNDPQQPEVLRVATAEALGWFTLSPRRNEIITACQSLKSDSKELNDEAMQTVNRLK